MRPAARLVRAGVEVIERQEPGHRPQGLGVLQANDAKRAKPASTRSPWPSTSLAPGGRFRTPCNIFSDRVTACEKHLPKARATPHDPHASAQGRKDRLVFDDAQRGLAVRVTGSGGRTYLCQYTLHGEKWRIPLGACSAVSLAKAREGAAVTTGSLTNLGGTAVAVALRAGAPKPDISSVEAFKRALVSAKSVVYADPSLPTSADNAVIVADDPNVIATRSTRRPATPYVSQREMFVLFCGLGTANQRYLAAGRYCLHVFANSCALLGGQPERSQCRSSSGRLL
jgi:hypothetical protein